jgi:hypothetical protein
MVKMMRMIRAVTATGSQPDVKGTSSTVTDARVVRNVRVVELLVVDGPAIVLVVMLVWVPRIGLMVSVAVGNPSESGATIAYV